MLFLLAGLAAAGVPGDDVDVWAVSAEIGARSGVTEPLTLGLRGRVDQRNGGWVAVDLRILDGVDHDIRSAVEGLLDVQTSPHARASAEVQLAGGWQHLQATRIGGFRADLGLQATYRNERAVWRWGIDQAQVDITSPEHIVYLGVQGRLGRKLAGDDDTLLTAHLGGGVDMPFTAWHFNSSFGESTDEILASMGLTRMTSLVRSRAWLAPDVRLVQDRVFFDLAPRITWLLPSASGRRAQVATMKVEREYAGRVAVGVMF